MLTISQAHNGTIGQESGERWTAETRLQPVHPKGYRLLHVVLHIEDLRRAGCKVPGELHPNRIFYYQVNRKNPAL